MVSEGEKVDPVRIGILAITQEGSRLARELRVFVGGDLYLPARLAATVEGAFIYEPPLTSLVKTIFHQYTHFIFVTSTGIAVRCISPLLRDKRSDPGVIVIDEKGENVIALIGGHQRNVNRMVQEITARIGGNAVITTASDLHGITSLDTWVRDRGWLCCNEEMFPEIIRALIEGEDIGVYQEAGEEIQPLATISPTRIHRFSSLEEAISSPVEKIIVVSDRRPRTDVQHLLKRILWLVPKSLVVGIGCRKGVGREEIESAIRLCFREEGLFEESIFAVATLNIKRSEEGLLDFARRRDLPALFFSPQDLEGVISPSAPHPTTTKITGISPVCEKAAIKACSDGRLIVPKKTFGKVTVAVARGNPVCGRNGKGKIYLVGTGPGAEDLLSIRAIKALQASSVVIGYSKYLEQLGRLIEGKRIITGGMGEERKRAVLALSLASQGNTVCLVSGGDPGIYGMASYLGEIISEDGGRENFEMETVPGIPAFCAAAAELGFPLSGDFAVISLSDYCVDWAIIEQRLEAAAKSGMVIILYNPTSSRRRECLAKAARVLLRHRGVKTPVGMARNVTREGKEIAYLELGDLVDFQADMNCLFIVGNTESRITPSGMYTPRGKKGRENDGE
jgi:cobalt-precorrin 5A hydrolase/precorrin-3B C17-methyltransferase